MADIISHAPETGLVSVVNPTVSEERRRHLDTEIGEMVEICKSQRTALDGNLDLWSDLYEMQTGPKDWPWPDSSNVFIPVVPTQMDSLVSRVMQLVVMGRLWVVKGLTPEAEGQAHIVERYYNAETYKNDWLNSFYQYTLLSARDGTSIMEVIWERRKHTMKTVVMEPVTDSVGMPALDPENPDQLLMKPKVVEKEITEYDNVRLVPVELRDFFLFPAWARSIEEAPTVARVLYLTEADLMAMVENGDLIKEEVEYVLSTVTEDELTQDEHTATYDIAQQVEVTTRETPTMEERGKGYIKVWRLHTREFDLDGDGSPEENILFYHYNTQRVLGIQAYQYLHGKRPFVSLTLLERPNRFYGFAVPERLAGIQVQINATHNQRNDQIELRTSPPLVKVAGVELEDEDQGWGPGQAYIGNSTQDVQLLTLPEVPLSSWQEENVLYGYAEQLLGLSDPLAQQASSGGRHTKYQMQLAQAALTIRMAIIADRLRRSLTHVFWQVHQLKLQYGPNSVRVEMPAGPTGGGPQPITITKQILALDYELGVNGTGSPLDRGARRQETLFLYNILQQNPLVASSMRRRYALTRQLLEDFEIQDIISIIGTEEDADKLQQAMQQQAMQQKQQEAQAAAAHGNPPASGQRPRRRQQQQAGPMGGGMTGG